MKRQAPIPHGEHRLLPRLRRVEENLRTASIVGEAVLETGKQRPKNETLQGDPGDLRGIPAIGRGVGGAIRGTRPDAITNREEHPEWGCG